MYDILYEITLSNIKVLLINSDIKYPNICFNNQISKEIINTYKYLWQITTVYSRIVYCSLTVLFFRLSNKYFMISSVIVIMIFFYNKNIDTVTDINYLIDFVIFADLSGLWVIKHVTNCTVPMLLQYGYHIDDSIRTV